MSSAAKPRRLPRVLVIDDDVMLVRSMQRVLGAFQVETETHPVRAVERVLAGDEFDMIICDLNMPTMTGYEVMLALNAHYADRPGRPIMVVVTGGDITYNLDATIDAIVVKPFAARELRTLIGSLLEGHTMLDA